MKSKHKTEINTEQTGGCHNEGGWGMDETGEREKISKNVWYHVTNG